MATPRNIIYGNDFFRDIIIPDSNESLKVTYWDLWIAIILVEQFDDDWNEMITQLRYKAENSRYLRDNFEALLTHIRLLQKTFSEAGLNITDILADSEASFLKQQKTKAKKKVLEIGFQPHEKSPWMLKTPRTLCREQAMRGHWHLFPVNPLQYANPLERVYKSGFYTENQSFTLEKKLMAFLSKHETRASHPLRFALYRAFLTVVLEKMERVDDSYGNIGDLYEEVFKKYFRLDRSQLEMELADFFQDFLELTIWEDYGGTYKVQPDFFKSLTPDETPLVEAILQQQREELNHFELRYQAENALTMLGMLYTNQQLFDKFVPIAKEMGTHEWERITTLSKVAEKHKQYDLALAVYENCLGSGGFHEDFLHKEYQKLKRRVK